MNILDLQYEFNSSWEFIGDNECDRNLLTIKRTGIDGSGHEMQIEENYCMTRNGIEEMRLGLEAMLVKIQDYLQD